MAKCNYSGTTILVGGARDSDLHYCNACQHSGRLVAISKQIPEAQVQENVWKVHQGRCPKCGGSGPIDVHNRYRLWSAVLLTRWSSLYQVSCRSCGIKKQVADAAIAFGSVGGNFRGALSSLPSKRAGILGTRLGLRKRRSLLPSWRKRSELPSPVAL